MREMTGIVCSEEIGNKFFHHVWMLMSSTFDWTRKSPGATMLNVRLALANTPAKIKML